MPTAGSSPRSAGRRSATSTAVACGSSATTARAVSPAIDPGLLEALLAARFVPVVSPPAAGSGEELLNVDADQMAARLAMALEAQALVLLTDVPGVLDDPADRGSVIGELTEERPDITGRMRHKVRAAIRARNVVDSVVIASGLVADPIRAALSGEGTVVTTAKGASG